MRFRRSIDLCLWTRAACSPSGRSRTSARSRAPPARFRSRSPPSRTRSPQLEREVGGKLFERGPGGPRLTRAGEALLAHADVIAERFALAETQLDEILREQDARLRIGAVPSALGGLVPAALQRIRERDPGALATVDRRHGRRLLPARVRSGELHLAVGFQDAARARDRPRRPRTPRADARALPRRAPAATTAWPARQRPPRRPRRRRLDRRLRRRHHRPRLPRRRLRAPARVHHARPIRHPRAITRGLAVTLAAELLAEAFEHAALRPIDGPAPERDVYALLPPGGRHPLAETTLAALTDVARELRAA